MADPVELNYIYLVIFGTKFFSNYPDISLKSLLLIRIEIFLQSENELFGNKLFRDEFILKPA